jgi:hypothetical protein
MIENPILNCPFADPAPDKTNAKAGTKVTA